MKPLARLAWRYLPGPTYRIGMWRWQWREWDGRCPRWADEQIDGRTFYRNCTRPVGRWRYAATGHCGHH